jgi:hypothetical protein
VEAAFAAIVFWLPFASMPYSTLCVGESRASPFLQSFVTLTYLSPGQQSDSRRIK